MNKKLIFFGILVCLLVFVAVLAFSQNNQNIRWEYTSLSISLTRNEDRTYRNLDTLNTRANTLGREGWELVSSVENWNSGVFTLFFKRRLP